jgi:hypothetical protein
MSKLQKNLQLSKDIELYRTGTAKLLPLPTCQDISPWSRVESPSIPRIRTVSLPKNSLLLNGILEGPVRVPYWRHSSFRTSCTCFFNIFFLFVSCSQEPITVDTVEALRSALASEADVQLVVSNHLLDTPEFRALMHSLDTTDQQLSAASLLHLQAGLAIKKPTQKNHLKKVLKKPPKMFFFGFLNFLFFMKIIQTLSLKQIFHEQIRKLSLLGKKKQKNPKKTTGLVFFFFFFFKPGFFPTLPTGGGGGVQLFILVTFHPLLPRGVT